MPGTSRPQRPLCTGTTRTGKPCRQRAMADDELCSVHAGLARKEVGRPYKLKPETHQRFVALLRASNAFETCARAVGVTPRVAKSWYQRGGESDAREPFKSFRVDCDRAEAEAESRAVAIIANAARDSWQAAAWLLERQHPERWARVSQRKEAEQLKEPEQPHDPFSEVDELAARRRQPA